MWSPTWRMASIFAWRSAGSFIWPISFETALRSALSASTSWMSARRCSSRPRTKSTGTVHLAGSQAAADQLRLFAKKIDINHSSTSIPDIIGATQLEEYGVFGRASPIQTPISSSTTCLQTINPPVRAGRGGRSWCHLLLPLRIGAASHSR